MQLVSPPVQPVAPVQPVSPLPLVPFWTENDSVDIFENHPVPVIDFENGEGTQAR